MKVAVNNLEVTDYGLEVFDVRVSGHESRAELRFRVQRDVESGTTTLTALAGPVRVNRTNTTVKRSWAVLYGSGQELGDTRLTGVNAAHRRVINRVMDEAYEEARAAIDAMVWESFAAWHFGEAKGGAA